MQRVTITLDDDLMVDLDRIIELRGYQNRSEAIRDLARTGIQQAKQELGESRDCVAALVYVYDHAARDLASRLVQTFHDHHDMAHATLHVHLDHESCMEVVVLKGRTRDVQHCAEHVIADRGVRYGRLTMVPVRLMPMAMSRATDIPIHTFTLNASHRAQANTADERWFSRRSAVAVRL